MFRYLPWKFIVQRAARAYGFADPAMWLARLRNFAQPSEVQEPIELVRAGVLFHARGIVNTKAIQHNLDWVWPYWVERQFDPEDVSFIPRAFSVSHINMTHRNWTAVGLPELPLYPLVDPRGLVTPIYDGWSIDFWLFDNAGRSLLPSRLHDELVVQQLVTDWQLSVRTSCRQSDLALESEARVTIVNSEPTLEINVAAESLSGGSLVVAVRPYNPEGVQFIDHVKARAGGDGWCVNGKHEVVINRSADRMLTSDYSSGDVFSFLSNTSDLNVDGEDTTDRHCKVGMVTAASIYRFGGPRTEILVRVPLGRELAATAHPKRFNPTVTWPLARADVAKLSVPDGRIRKLYDAAVSTLVLLSADEIVPGPYTYRRFWFRDACLMMHAMLAVGLTKRCRRAIERFFERQLSSGYFRSQEGEWDSNGQVLWILERFAMMTGEMLDREKLDAIARAVRWIDRKRAAVEGDSPHAGLLPAGFSAEHLGPNDHYYWDDYWAEAGLLAAERMFERHGRSNDAARARRLADDMHASIERSIDRIPASRALGGIPASPYRRMDAGAVGSLVVDYPLQLTPPGDARVMATVNHLMNNFFHKGGFFQDIIHSGINAYLTLDIAQTLLRAGDGRYRALMETVAGLASPTGQWPEAIHPQTLGGCMGDGQHGWAAAEWIMAVRNCFVREEADRIIVGSGLFPEWFGTTDELSFGPTLTAWGPVTVRIARPNKEPLLTVEAKWRGSPPEIQVAIPDFRHLKSIDSEIPIALERIAESREIAEARR